MTEINEQITLLQRHIHELSEDNRNYLEQLDERDEEIERLKMELELAKPLFSRRQLMAQNERYRRALEDIRDVDAGGFFNKTAVEALGGVSID